MATATIESTDIRSQLLDEFKTLGKWTEENKLLYNTSWKGPQNVPVNYAFDRLIAISFASGKEDLPKTLINTFKRLGNAGYPDNKLVDLLVDVHNKFRHTEILGSYEYVVDVLRISENPKSLKDFDIRYNKLKQARLLREGALLSKKDIESKDQWPHFVKLRT
jgi:hypothetical protein